MVGKNQLVYDTAGVAADQDNVGAFLKSAAGTLITDTGGSLNVNVTNTVTVQATDLDIRDLTHVSDSVKIGDGTDFLAINADGSINVNADISVVNGHEKAEDAAHASGDIGSFFLAIRNDAAATSLTSANGDYSGVAVDEFGRMFTSTSLTAEKLEDAAHASGDPGIFTLAVAQAALAASVSADGDYGAFKLNARGALWTAPVGTVADDAADTENPVKIGSRSRWGALAALSTDGDRADMISDKFRRVYVNDGANIGVAAATVTVTTTEIALSATPISGRRLIMIENNDNKPIYIGPTGLTAGNGFKLNGGAVAELPAGEDIQLFALTSAGSANVRVLELA